MSLTYSFQYLLSTEDQKPIKRVFKDSFYLLIKIFVYIKMNLSVILIYFSRNGGVYFNIREEESIIQTSLMKGSVIYPILKYKYDRKWLSRCKEHHKIALRLSIWVLLRQTGQEPQAFPQEQNAEGPENNHRQNSYAYE